MSEVKQSALKGLSASHLDKLAKAIEYLGEKYVLHPNYKTDPRHNLLKLGC